MRIGDFYLNLQPLNVLILDTDPLPSPLAALINLSILLQSAIEFHAPADGWGAWALIVVIACACLMISAFVSGSEIAYFGLTPAEIDELRDDGDNPRSRKAFSMVSRPERLLATILISNNLVNITMVVLMTFAISKTVQFNNAVVNFLVQTVFLTFLLLLFGEIFPKLVARGRALWWVRMASSFLGMLYRLFGPLARLMVKSTSIVNRIVTKKNETISTDELEKALEISDLKEGKDKEMLEGILQFGEKEVCDIMIPRIDLTAIESHDDWDEVLKTITSTGYSRIPVYDTSQDSIVGILYSKDLLPYIESRPEGFRWQTLLREPYYVPESKMIDDLLEDFRKRKMHIAIVVDEYGGTRGIATLEDIIEEIVGQIDDEYDHQEKMYTRLADGSYIFDAKISLGDFCRVLGIEEEQLGDDREAETLAGLVLELKGDFPMVKEVLRCGPCQLTVLGMERHRITRVRVRTDDHAAATDTKTQQ